MSPSSFPVTYHPTGIGTTAADIARLPGVNAVSPIGYISDIAALTEGAAVTADAEPAGHITEPTGTATPPILTEFDRSLRRLLDAHPSEQTQFDRTDYGSTGASPAPSGRTYIEWDYPQWTPLSPDVDRARRANAEWVHRTGMVQSKKAMEWYMSWDLAKMAGYIYPYARGERLDVCTDTMAFYFLFDDQFDGALGRRPQQAAAVCEDVIDVVHNPTRTRKYPPPIITAFADVWTRAIALMSPAWRARAAHDWEYYFSSYPHEAVDRIRGSAPSMNRFLHVRRGTAGTHGLLNLCELGGDFEVNPIAFHSPELSTQRQIAADLLFFCNDVHSVDKEEPRGDVDNLVLVVEEERRCTRLQAFHHITSIFDEHMKKFDQACLDAYDTLRWLPSADFDNAVNYSKAAFTAICGHHQWEIESLRFVNANTVVPAAGNGYLEDLTKPLRRGLDRPN
ncbi:terpene synthase family protein [Nocardia terpenica]|uniref:Terpene cyclase n=1 Tax=Nocardia terpenica TaxID=455432 RepID=A0A6G9Z829_9NOCA|nr:terpene synthase family protein [Nocardia terpenica]QIS21507.1 terpene cyclase [Nocardia terpenica]